MTSQEAKTYLHSFINFEKDLNAVQRHSFKLERVRNLLAELNCLDVPYKIIHVAGTKGKGSTCAMIAQVLKESGYKAGLYTSPHLNSEHERIRILDSHNKHGNENDACVFQDAISDEEMFHVIQKAEPFIEKYHKDPRWGRLTYFEILTVIALIHFSEQKVDVAVLETGLGGRLDATNAVNGDVCVITPISMEHAHILGDSLEKITSEKVGIVKQAKQRVIVAKQEEDVKEKIIEHCKNVGVKPAFVDEISKTQIINNSAKETQFSTATNQRSYPLLRLSLKGKHQIENAITAIAALEVLKEIGFGISNEAVLQGFARVVWPCRMEILGCQNRFLLDAAHNEASGQVLVEAVNELFPNKKITVIIGMSNDKDRAPFCRLIDSIADRVIVTRADHPRAHIWQDDELSNYFLTNKISKTSRLMDALELVPKELESDQMILVTGSLFLAAQAREIIMRMETRKQGSKEAKKEAE